MTNTIKNPKLYPLPVICLGIMTLCLQCGSYSPPSEGNARTATNDSADAQSQQPEASEDSPRVAPAIDSIQKQTLKEEMRSLYQASITTCGSATITTSADRTADRSTNCLFLVLKDKKLQAEAAIAIIDFLLTQGADPNARSQNGDGLLHHLIKNMYIPNRQELFDLLLRIPSIQVDLQDAEGKWPLQVAVQCRMRLLSLEELSTQCQEDIVFLNHAIAAILKKAPRQQKLQSPSWLLVAVEEGDLDTTQRLLSQRVDPQIWSMIGEKVLRLLIRPEIMPNRQELFDLLVDWCLAHSSQSWLIEIAKLHKEAVQPKENDIISMEGSKSCWEYIAFLNHVIQKINSRTQCQAANNPKPSCSSS